MFHTNTTNFSFSCQSVQAGLRGIIFIILILITWFGLTAIIPLVSNANGINNEIPQESCLSPLLFIIHLNDLTECFKSSKACIYVDDTRLTMS